MNTGGKIVTGIVSVLLLALAVFVYFKFFFVYSEGTNEGDINYFQREGFVFKTYEGKLIQSGIRSKTAGSIQSYEFDFSIENKEIAERLMLEGGKVVELRYKEYFGALPWRGFTKYIVDSIITHETPALPEASVLDDSSSVIKEQVQLAE